MRLIALLTALLLVSLPLVGAQSGCPEGCPEPERGRPGSGDGSDGNETDDNRTAQNGTTPERAGPERCSADPDAPGCRAAQERFRADARAAAGDLRYISFQVDRDNRTLHDYRVGSHLAFDAIVFEDPGEVRADAHGVELRIRTNESVLRLHDAPRGNIEYKGDNHSLVLDLPAGAFLDRHGQTERGHFLLIDYGGTHTGKLAADGLVIEGDLLRITGHAAFHIQAKPQEPPATPARQAVQDALEDAEEKRQLGARVSIRGAPSMAMGMAAAGDDVEVTTYDDLEVEVSLPPTLGTNSTIDVTVSAELDEGRTVALELDPEVLSGLSIGRSGDLAPRYYDLNDDGTWTEVVFRKAGSIQDILDATDDAGQPEYWIVEDEHGIQVLVSFPHWSTHRVSLFLEEVVDFVTQPSVLVGVVAGVGGVLVAAATLFLPRRRQEDLY